MMVEVEVELVEVGVESGTGTGTGMTGSRLALGPHRAADRQVEGPDGLQHRCFEKSLGGELASALARTAENSCSRASYLVKYKT